MVRLQLKFLVVVILFSSFCFAQKKWVWEENRRSNPDDGYSGPKQSGYDNRADSKRGRNNYRFPDSPSSDGDYYRGDSSYNGGRPRYQVTEGIDEDSNQSAGSYGPNLNIRPIPYPEQPPPRPNRPLPPLIPPPPQPGYQKPPFNSRPPVDTDVGILTGPVPSWEKPEIGKNGDPTSFDSCKCVHSFNCKSPGLQFGKCDAGKQYCCYNNPRYGLKSESGPAGGFGNKYGPNDDGPAVLSGPGGPVDVHRPDFPGLEGGRPIGGPRLPPFYDERSKAAYDKPSPRSKN